MIRLLALCAFLASSLAYGQNNNVLTIETPPMVRAKAGSTVDAKLTLKLREGYHLNSNTPSDPYLIPLRVTWTSDKLETTEVVFPKPQMEKYSFSEKPLSVFSGTFEIVTHFKVAPKAAAGMAVVPGKVRYQACNDVMCLAPKTLDVTLAAEVLP